MCLAELIFAAVHFLPLGGCLLVAVSSPSELFLDLPSFSTVISALCRASMVGESEERWIRFIVSRRQTNWSASPSIDALMYWTNTTGRGISPLSFSECPLFQFSATSPQRLYFRRNGELSNLFHFVFILVFGIGPTSIGLGYNGSNRSYSSCSSCSSYNSYCLILCLV